MSKAEEQLKERALGYWTPIMEAGVSISRYSMIVGYNAHRMKEESLFGVLGFSSEEEARKKAGVGESTWYAMIALARAYPTVAMDRFIAMKQANAKAMVDLPDEKRQSSEWLRMAEVDPIDEFAAKVEHELNGKARPSDTKERSTTMKLPMPESRKTVIEQKARIFAEAHGIDPADVGKAIEVALVETTESATLVGSVTNAVARARHIKEMIQGEMSFEELVKAIETEIDEMILDFSKALTQVEEREEVTA